MDFYLIFLMILFPERISLSRAEWKLGTIVGDNSEVEDSSDIDDPVWDADYQSPPQEPSSSEDEDPIPLHTEPSRGRKRCRGENDYCSDLDLTRSCTPRQLRQTQQIEADGSNDGPEEPTTGPSHQGQSKKGLGIHWRATLLTPNLAQFEHEEETKQDREGWTTLDCVELYMDKDLMKMIAYCSNATSLASVSGFLLNTPVDEIYHFLGACIFMSCVPTPTNRDVFVQSLTIPCHH